MRNCYPMLKALVKEYHSTKFPYELNDITTLERAAKTEEVIDRLNLLKDEIFVFAMLYVDEREGIKHDL